MVIRKGAVGIIFKHDKGNFKFLILRRKFIWKGWEFPKGGVKGAINKTVKESERTAVLREIKEETGLDVKISKPFFANEWRPVVRGEQWHIVGIFFLCNAVSDNIVLSEDHEEFKWIKPEEYKEHNLIPNLHPAFEEFLKSS